MQKDSQSFLEKNPYGLQEYLSIGYIYLIILGILSDVIYYRFFNINILPYSSLSDIIMAPINTLTNDIRLLIAVIVMIIAIYFFYAKFLPSFHQKNRDKSWYRKTIIDIEKADKGYASLKEGKSLFTLVFTFFTLMFLGIKIGSGMSLKSKIETGEIKLSHIIVSNDNTEKHVKIIGQNSSYIFYVAENQTDVTIIPISGNIKEIKGFKNFEIKK
ncbi:MAG: hypothetical protein V4683_13100 [Bacteroidota bacterium]